MFPGVMKYTIDVIWMTPAHRMPEQAVVVFDPQSDDARALFDGLRAGYHNRLYTNQSRRLFKVVPDTAREPSQGYTVAIRTFGRTDAATAFNNGKKTIDVFAFMGEQNQEMDDLPVW